MKTCTVTEAKAKLSELLHEVEEESIYLTRNGEVAGVLVDPDEWESVQETLEILADPALMLQIRASKRSKKVYTMDEVFGDIEE
jgi:antitoxin YefM